MKFKNIILITIVILAGLFAGGAWLFNWLLGDTLEASGSLLRFQISQDGSEARFYIDEVLRGNPVEVVGVSNQIAGELAVDFTDLSSVQVGVVQVNARDLETDSEQRNRAIRNQILQTDSHELITFTPLEVSRLSNNAQPGQETPSRSAAS